MPKNKPVAEQAEAALARPPWLPPEDEERRWPLAARGRNRRRRDEPAARAAEPAPEPADDLEQADFDAGTDFEAEAPSTGVPVPAPDANADADATADVSAAPPATPVNETGARHRAPEPEPRSPSTQPSPLSGLQSEAESAVATDWQEATAPEQVDVVGSLGDVRPSPAADILHAIDAPFTAPEPADELPLVASEPIEAASEPEDHRGPAAINAETTPEVPTTDHTPEPADSSPPAGPEPAEEVDEIELRAAALLAAMEAKRAELASTAQAATPDPVPVRDPVPVPDPVFIPDLGPEPDVSGPEAGTPEEAPVEEAPDPVVGADHQSEPDYPSEPEDRTEHDFQAQPDVPDHQSDPLPTRRPALPPWQLPTATTWADYEQFGPESGTTFRDDESSPPVAVPDHVSQSRHPDAGPRPEPEAAPAEPPADAQAGPPPQHWPPPPPFPPRVRPGLPLPTPPPGWRPPPPRPPNWPVGHPGAATPPPHRNPAAQGAPPPQRRLAPPPNYRPPQAFRVPPPLDEAELTDRHLNAPQSGWRSSLHKATGGHVNLGPSRRERLLDEIQEQIRQPIAGDFRIAVLSIKGGVGKTTTTLGLGSALAMVRHDRVIAVDANPDRGTLGERVRDLSTQSTVRDLLSDPNIHSYADVRNHTLMATSRLEVLASEQEPAVSEVFCEADYRRTVEILRHYYNVILTDCGTGIMHSTMSGILDLAHTIVLVSAPAIDAARSASATLDWLMQHGYSGLVRGARVVFSASRPGSAHLKLDKLYDHFATRCQSVHMIPFDPHLSEGADIDLGLLRPETMDAYLDLAASVSEDFGRLRGPVARP